MTYISSAFSVQWKGLLTPQSSSGLKKIWKECAEHHRWLQSEIHEYMEEYGCML